MWQMIYGFFIGIASLCACPPCGSSRTICSGITIQLKVNFKSRGNLDLFGQIAGGGVLRPGGVTLVEMEPYGVGRVFR